MLVSNKLSYHYLMSFLDTIPYSLAKKVFIKHDMSYVCGQYDLEQFIFAVFYTYHNELETIFIIQIPIFYSFGI